MIGLASLAANVALSVGYLLYQLLSAGISWSVFNKCSTIGALSCFMGIAGAMAGKASTTRVLIAFGGFTGLFFWYLTIGAGFV